MVNKPFNASAGAKGMPDRIPPEDRDKLIDDMVLKLRMSTNQAPPAPVTGWAALRAEWVKPSGVIPLMGLILSCAAGGLLMQQAVNDSTKANARQDTVLSEQTKALSDISRQLERASDLAEGRASQQREELLAWREWRKVVDAGLQTGRDVALEVSANKTRSEALDTRISRVVEMFQSTVKEIGQKQEQATRETNQKLERILIEQAQVRTRLEGRTGERPPFLESPTWRGLPGPFTLKASSRVPAFLRVLSGSGSSHFQPLSTALFSPHGVRIESYSAK